MPRPVQPRRVARSLAARGFRPIGRPASGLPVVTLGQDELEALRLADLEGLYQEAAAERMAISRPTFARILARGRRLVAEALIEEKVLLVGPAQVVEGAPGPMSCPIHGGERRRGRGCRCRRRYTSAGDSRSNTSWDGREPGGGNDEET